MHNSQSNVEIPFWSTQLVNSRRERTATISFENVAKSVAAWVKKRPLIEKMDSREQVVAHMTRAEAEELRQELLLVHQQNDSLIEKTEYFSPPLQQIETNVQFAMWRDVFMEAQDGAFLALANAWGRKLSLDFDVAYREMNGQGKSSDIIDQLQDLGSGIAESNPTKAIEHYLATWGSFVTHQKVFIDPSYILEQVIRKNEGNYPESFFQFDQLAFDQNGRLQKISLNSEEEIIAFGHRIRCFRAIRNANMLAGIHRPNGLLQVDYANYYRQILNHRDVRSFSLVASNLARTKGTQGNGFNVHDLYSLEEGPHKVVPALSQSNPIIYHNIFSSAERSRDGTIEIALR